jgi:hypothetical protein
MEEAQGGKDLGEEKVEEVYSPASRTTEAPTPSAPSTTIDQVKNIFKRLNLIVSAVSRDYPEEN